MSPNWITNTLKEFNFKEVYNPYHMKRGKETAHIGTTPIGWSVVVYIGDKSCLCYKEEKLRDFLIKDLRQKKLERII